MRSNVMEFWSFCDSTSCRVENKLKPIELLITDVEIKSYSSPVIYLFIYKNSPHSLYVQQ